VQLALGCGDGGTSGADAGELGGSNASGGGNGTANGALDPHQACVDRINELRATLNLPALARWTEAEACSNQQSADDHQGGGAHGGFGRCEEFGQNTCPGWPGIDAVIGGCLDSMWAEGPPPTDTCDGDCFQAHGHYLNMTSTQFTKVACGFHDDGQGDVWSNQNFK